MLVVGLIISVVAPIGEGILSTVLFAVGYLVLVGGVVVLDGARRR